MQDRALKPEDLKEVMTFPSHCSACHAPGEERMVKIDIPYFKEVVVMSFTCDNCGYKNNEVKAGGAVAPTGRRIAVLIRNKEDLSRDVLKSETAGLYVPEIDLEVVPGSLGGRFSTVEGLLCLVRDELKNNAFMSGDSVGPRSKTQWQAFLAELEKVRRIRSFLPSCSLSKLALTDYPVDSGRCSASTLTWSST
jgi:zinc finger protein